MSLKISRATAFVIGIVLPCIETWRRWRMLADWPSWLDDHIPAALLLYAWQVGRSEVSRSRPYLMAAWGYTLGIAYMSFFGQLKNAPGPIRHGTYCGPCVQRRRTRAVGDVSCPDVAIT